VRGLTFVDVAGAEMLAQEARRRKKLGGKVYFYSCKEATMDFLRKSGAMKDIGEENFFPVMSNWVGSIYPNLDPEICQNCTARIFAECHDKLPDGKVRSPHLNPLAQADEETNGKNNINSGESRAV